MDDFEELNQYYNSFYRLRSISRHNDDQEISTVVDLDATGEENDEETQQTDPSPLASEEEPVVTNALSSEDDEEASDLQQKISTCCMCQQNCLGNIDEGVIENHIYNLREMDKESKEMYIMGALHKVSTDSKRSRYGERKRTRYEYKFEANNICRTAFLTIYDIGERTLKKLIRHVNTNGNVPRVHGNKGKKPYHALSFVDIEKVVKFIFQFAQENGLPQPAAPRGRDDTAPVFLPAYLTKTIVHTNYVMQHL